MRPPKWIFQRMTSSEEGGFSLLPTMTERTFRVNTNYDQCRWRYDPESGEIQSDAHPKKLIFIPRKPTLDDVCKNTMDIILRITNITPPILKISEQNTGFVYFELVRLS